MALCYKNVSIVGLHNEDFRSYPFKIN